MTSGLDNRHLGSSSPLSPTHLSWVPDTKWGSIQRQGGASTSLASPSVCQAMVARLKKAALFSSVALTSLPAGSFQTTSPHRLRSSLSPQAHTHIQGGLYTLRQSRKEPEPLPSLPGKSRARSPGALRNAPSEKCRGQLPVGLMLPPPFLGGRQASALECGERGWFLCRNSMGEGTSDVGYVQRLRGSG